MVKVSLGSLGVVFRGECKGRPPAATSDTSEFSVSGEIKGSACQEYAELVSPWGSHFPCSGVPCAQKEFVFVRAHWDGRSSLQTASSMLAFELWLIRALSYDLNSTAVYKTNHQPEELALCFYAVKSGVRAPSSRS